MKKLLLSFLFLTFTLFLEAQYAPMGMRYQAVVRDADGAIISNESITARIELLTMQDNQIYYEEVHEINSNEFGILNFTIGEGQALSGDFSNIPWSDQNIWVRTSIKKHGDTDFDIISTSKLYSVPYAQHAVTAGSLVQDDQALTPPFFDWPKIGYSWALIGNKLSTKYSDPPLLGTLDKNPVVFITDNTERMRINEGGNIEIQGDLGIDANLAINDNLNVTGNGTISDSFTVHGPVEFTEYLKVEGKAMIEDSLTVNGPFDLAGNLKISGKSNFADSFAVNGPAVFDINVDGLQTTQSSYPVLIKGSKQGLAIDLTPATDKCLTSHRGNNYISFWRDGTQKGRIEGMGRADLDPTGLLNLIIQIISDPDANGLGSAFNINLEDPLQQFGNDLANIIDFNTGSLPYLSGGELPSLSGGKPPKVDFSPPDFDAGSFPSLDAGSFPTLAGGELPSISFNTPMFSNPFDDSPLMNTVDDLLENFNPDKTGGDIGCIIETASPAQAAWALLKSSLLTAGLYPEQEDQTNFESQIFSNYTLDILQGGISTLTSAVTFLTSLGSILDPEDIFSQGLDLMANIYSLVIYGSYSDINIGVAYESGAGDYAEWLLRADPNEFIQPGDVVGVIGGKISKAFIHADQFMVASTSPLLLGNMPESPEEERLSEKIAFVGQVPVKVMGKVNIGDYILPSGMGDGTGISVSPEKMLAKDYQRIIGIAWEQNHDSDFIHLVNTAVGINHNDMAKVIEQMQFTLNHIQDQLKKMDPTYVSHDYEVTIDSFGLASLDYSVSDSHPTKVAGYFRDKKYTSNADILRDVRERMMNLAGIDLSEAPIIDFALSNPNRAKCLADEYQHILEEMISVKGELLKNLDHD